MSDAVQTPGTLTLRLIETPEDVARVREAAKGDKAGVHAPTHLFEVDGEVVGYASVNAIPVLTGWLHNDKVSQADGVACIEALEQVAREQGCRLVCMPTTDDCRFKPLMEQMGYGLTGKVNLYLKPLRESE